MTEANVPIVPNVPGASVPSGASVLTYTMRSPLWGLCRIVPREAEPTDTMAIGYVALEGSGKTLKLAIWKDGEWLDTRLKAFPSPVLQSYSVEKEDGTPIF